MLLTELTPGKTLIPKQTKIQKNYEFPFSFPIVGTAHATARSKECVGSRTEDRQTDLVREPFLAILLQ